MNGCRMFTRTSMSLALLAVLAACAAPQQSPEFAAKNRPLEERCVRAQRGESTSKPGQSSADIRAEAQAAARRGELDKACDWL